MIDTVRRHPSMEMTTMMIRILNIFIFIMHAMQYFPIAIDVLHNRKESKIPRHFLQMKSISFTSKVLSDFHWFRVSKLRKMVEKNCAVFQSFEREIRAISLNEWQTPDDVNAEKAKGIFEKSSHHHGRIFLFSGGSTHQWEKSQRVLTFLTQNGSFFRKNFHDREPVEVER